MWTCMLQHSAFRFSPQGDMLNVYRQKLRKLSSRCLISAALCAMARISPCQVT